jgi:hypothetical protein
MAVPYNFSAVFLYCYKGSGGNWMASGTVLKKSGDLFFSEKSRFFAFPRNWLND